LVVTDPDSQCLNVGVSYQTIISENLDDSTKFPSSQQYNAVKSDFEQKQKGPFTKGIKFGESREKLIFYSFVHSSTKNAYVPCSTKYDVIAPIGLSARKASMGARNYAEWSKSRLKFLLV